MNFLESLGGKKQPAPIHHIHRHYYPVPLPVLLPKPAPPPKIEIDLTSLHRYDIRAFVESTRIIYLRWGGDIFSGHDSLRSLGWSSQDYGKIYEPEIVVPSEAPWVSPLPEAWPDTTGRKSWGWENNEILEKDHAYKEAKPPGILLQVPLRQQIVLYQPPAKDNKSTLLSTLLKKIRRINDALFHPEEEDCPQPHDNKPHITNSLTYSTS
ncbi:hypothetical protein TSAR_013317 [Trichomalopsis sarcophagae]|uniref:Uncharacterized protein n=1 Tax=Trichomalopsis sarcophagae TaxID=543379 RepID=A0A232EKH8_9HYME|nr:hypothetical protein TSAR_013317 [Trichomalopsis sarcophagae]